MPWLHSTPLQAAQRLAAVTEISDQLRSALVALLAEPAFSRVVAQDEDGARRIVFVFRVRPRTGRPRMEASPSATISHLVEIAALPIGGTITGPGSLTFTVLEKAMLYLLEAGGVPGLAQHLR